MISSQQAKPPPRSLAHDHHPLRGVITTRGAAPLFVPGTAATTLNALKPGMKINIEVDLLARYLERMVEAPR